MPNVIALRAAIKSHRPALGEELLTVVRCLGKLAEDASRSELPPAHRAAVLGSLAQAASSLQGAADALGRALRDSLPPNARP